MKSPRESQTKGVWGSMVLFWEGVQSFRQEVMLSFFLLETFSPARISRGMRLSCERNCNGFSVKASTRALFQSAHSTAGHKIPKPWVRCQVCVCLERRSITPIAVLPCSAVSTFPPPKGWARRANGDRECPVEQSPSTGEMHFTGEL